MDNGLVRMIMLTCSLLYHLLLVTGMPGQVLLLEAEDDMKSKRITEIQDVLAEKMQDNYGQLAGS